jgi:mono/diheme cytochrome c family protein
VAIILAILSMGKSWAAEPTVRPSDQPVSYRRDVQPILARYCFACHGPDSAQREADLRLDREEAAKAHAIVPGDPDSSELMARVLSKDESLVMPPPETGHTLGDKERDTLRRWIQQGAAYQSHWAFDPIQRPSVPELGPASQAWALNPIDHFVAQAHQNEGFRPSPTAPAHRLVRRLHFDLVGLPPTSETVANSVNHESEPSHSELIDQLLGSPRYGEHMAAGWLDLARYADTNGYQNDFYRSQWPWRDWVIQSFNQHQPYDQFLIEQLAGDMLPEPTLSQLVATGFNRNNRSVTEGGSIEEEWRIENAVDRVETTAVTFLGLTMGCARCHDHKYDPVSQEDFYRFMAFFNNVDELGVYIETRGNTGPQVKVPTPQQVAELADIEQRLAAARQELEQAQSSVNEAELWKNWQASLTSHPAPIPTGRALTSSESQAESPAPTQGDSASNPTRNPGAAERTTGADDWESPSPVGPSRVFTAAAGQGVPLPAPLTADIDRQTAFSWSIWVEGSARGTLVAKMDDSQAHRGFDGIILEDGRLKIHLIHQWNQNAIAVISKARLTDGRWNHVAVTYDGSSKAAGVQIYIDGQSVPFDVEVDRLSDSIKNEVPFTLGQRHNSVYLKGRLSDFAWFDECLSAEAVAAWQGQSLLATNALSENLGVVPSEINSTADSDANAAKVRAIATEYLMNRRLGEWAVKVSTLEKERETSLSRQQTCMIMRDREGYRPTYLLNRGQYDLPDTSKELWPQVPEALPPMTEEQPANRLGLARWMVDPRNPLVARVAVNRIWTHFFGRGLVDTVDNFGIQGSPPSHPELLDWLASELRDSGWNVQHIQKLIVTSATYRQDSSWNAEFAERDPDNRWLWRGPRHRLTGEQLRDQALAVSGLLSSKIGGLAPNLSDLRRAQLGGLLRPTSHNQYAPSITGVTQ